MKTIVPCLICIFIGYVIYWIATFSFFDGPEKFKEIAIPNKDYTIDLYYTPSNATAEENIQVRQDDEIINVYPQYNFVDGDIIKNDTLILVLSDTSISQPIKDTFFIKLP